MMFDDILVKLGAQLARHAKMHKKQIAAQLDAAAPVARDVPPQAMTTKAQLRRAYGISRIPPHLAEKLGPTIPQNGEQADESWNQNE